MGFQTCDTLTGNSVSVELKLLVSVWHFLDGCEQHLQNMTKQNLKSTKFHKQAFYYWVCPIISSDAFKSLPHLCYLLRLFNSLLLHPRGLSELNSLIQGWGVEMFGKNGTSSAKSMKSSNFHRDFCFFPPTMLFLLLHFYQIFKEKKICCFNGD